MKLFAFLLTVYLVLALCHGEQVPLPFVKRLAAQLRVLLQSRQTPVIGEAIVLSQARCLPSATALMSTTCVIPKKQVLKHVVFNSNSLLVQHRLLQPNQSVLLDSATTIHIVTKPSSLMLLTDQLLPLRVFTPAQGETFSLSSLKTHRVRYLKNVGGGPYGELIVETKASPNHSTQVGRPALSS
jgi:hypothetical protein